MKKILLLLVCIVFAGANLVVAQGPTINLEKGHSYKFNSHQNIETFISFQGQAITGENEVISDFEYNVKDIDAEGNYLTEYKLTKFSMSTAQMGQSQKYSTDPDATDNSEMMTSQIAEPLKKVLAASFEVKLSPKGKVLELIIPEGVSKEILDMIQLNEERLSNSFKYLSGAAFEKGETFTVETETNQMGKTVNSENIYTPTKVSKKKIILSLASVVAEVKGDEKKEIGKLTGEIILDGKTNLIKTSTIDGEMDIEIEQQGMLLPVNIKQHVVTTSR